jgi:hypothetical protein
MTGVAGSKAAGGKPALLLDSIGKYKFWRIQKRNAAKLLKEIIFRWRGASAYVLGKPGKWVVWPRERWCEWTGLSRNQLDRALKELVEVRLINRERHKFSGSQVRTFLRPTQLALQYAGKPKDLADAITAKSNAKSSAIPTDNAVNETGEKIKEKSLLTSLPSLSNKTTPTSLQEDATGSEGPGVCGEENQNTDLVTKLHEKAKKQKAFEEANFLEIKGAHEKYVRYPPKMFPNWPLFSPEMKAHLYGKYVQYVDNWHKGKKGQEYAKWNDWTEEDEAALIAAYDEKAKAGKNSG